MPVPTSVPKPSRKVIPWVNSSAPLSSPKHDAFRRPDGDNSAEEELYRHGLPHQLEQVGGCMTLKSGSIRVTFPDNHQMLGGFEISRDLYLVASRLVKQSLSRFHSKELDWRTFPQQVSPIATEPDGLVLTSLFTNEKGELDSKLYFRLKSHGRTG